ncbi:coiled-coil domain-containing protein 137 [Trichomycterus rosablanca]|uniref:coiled-coil domain-containing protein 137 n=1 Tax=Trichomycterus rosablanca TaxID=2290929 RepID=UPI002F35178C
MVKKSSSKTFCPDQQTNIRQLSKKKKEAVKPKLAEEHLEQIPFRLREIMKSKEKMNQRSSKLKKVNRAHTSKLQTDKCKQEDIPVPHFRRRKQESERAYLRRMSQETQHVFFLTKNQVERQPEQEPKDKETKSKKQKSEKKKLVGKKRLQRLHKKKVGRQERNMEKDFFIDKMHFGEVVLAPPSLTAKPSTASVKFQRAPKSLLLNSVLEHTKVSAVKPSMARERIVKEEHERVVQAYRRLKRQTQEQQACQKARIKKLLNPQ